MVYDGVLSLNRALGLKASTQYRILRTHSNGANGMCAVQMDSKVATSSVESIDSTMGWGAHVVSPKEGTVASAVAIRGKAHKRKDK